MGEYQPTQDPPKPTPVKEPKVNNTSTATSTTTASWTIQHGQVSPDQIEVLWSGEGSETRTIRTASLSDVESTAGTVTLTGTNDTYEDALARAINELKSLPVSIDMVTVASFTVTSGSTAFVAQGMTHVEDAIQFIHEVLQGR